MVILKNLSEAEYTFISRLNTLLQYRIAIGAVKTVKEAKDYVLSEYFERLPKYDGEMGEFDGFEQRQHVLEIFTEKNLESAFKEVQFMDDEEKETFIFEMEGYHL
jgi:hypothetical protein